MLKVGLTGGIGSGKTTVAKIFELLGIPVYYADDAAKRIMNEDQELRIAIQKQFGDESYRDKVLDRAYLAKKVFDDPLQLEILNSLVHPVTINDASRWMQEQKTPYTLKEAALIFESGSGANLDYVIGVYAPVELRITRAMQRSNISMSEVQRRMESQIDEKIKMMLCDFVIRNDEKELIIPQVNALHKTLLEIAEQNVAKEISL